MNKIKMYDVIYLKNKNKYRKLVTYKKNDRNNLKEKHEKISEFINKKTYPSKFAYGYVQGRSIYDNAKVHMYNDYFIKLDIKNFFSEINLTKLTDILYFELNKTEDINKTEVQKIINECSVSNKGLPLGLVTSPILSNLYLKNFDGLFYFHLKKTAEKFNMKHILYTRYADDLTISFKKNIKESYSNEQLSYIKKEIIDNCAYILKQYSLHLNKDKTSLISLENSNHVRITGISIVVLENNYRKLSVGRKRIRNLYWEVINLYENNNNLKGMEYRINKVKGMESFIYSVHRQGYEKALSTNMKEKINKLGFENLHQMIKNL